MSNCLNMFKKLGFSKKMKSSAVRERKAPEPPLPNMMPPTTARPSSVSTTDESDSVSGDSLEGTVDLIVNLPDKRTVTASVEKRMPMMDLLVHIATANKFSPGNHILKIVSDMDGTSFMTYKPSTPIGSLNTTVVYVEPKKVEKNSSKTSKVSGAQPFEKTFRLQVHLPKQQLLVLRVSSQIKLCDLHKKICDNKGLDPTRYKLQHSQDEDVVLDLALSLQDYRLTEINMVGSTSSVVRESSHLSDTSSAAVYKDSEKMKRNTLFFLGPKSKLSVSDNNGDDGSRRDISPEFSEAASCQSSASLNRPASYPARKPMKKRPAPPPPPAPVKTQTRSERPPPPPPLRSKSTSSSVKSGHSRHSSDSSGYHDSSVHGDSPELIEPAEAKLDRNIAASNSSLATAGMKKRRAPRPPSQRLFTEPPCVVNDGKVNESSGRLDCKDNGTITVKPELPPPPQSASPLSTYKSPALTAGVEGHPASDRCYVNADDISPAHKIIAASNSNSSESLGSLTNGEESESKESSSSSTIKEIKGSQEHLSEVDTRQVHAALNDPLPPSPTIANSNDFSHTSHLPSETHQVPLKHVPSSSPNPDPPVPGTTHDQIACDSVAPNASSCARTGDKSKEIIAVEAGNDNNNNDDDDASSFRSCRSFELMEAEIRAAEAGAKEEETDDIQDALSDIDQVLNDAAADMISLSSHSSMVAGDDDVKAQENVGQQKSDAREEIANEIKLGQEAANEAPEEVASAAEIKVEAREDVASSRERRDVESTSAYSHNATTNKRTERENSVSEDDDDEGLTFEEPDTLAPMVARPGHRKPLLNFSIATYKSRSKGFNKLTKVESFHEAEKPEVNDHRVAPARASSFHEHSNLTATTDSPSAKPTRNIILTVNPAKTAATKAENDDENDDKSEGSENDPEEPHPSQEHSKSASMTNLEAIDGNSRLRKTQSELFLNEGNNGEEYLQLQNEYLKLQKKMFFWQQQLLNNQSLLQRQHILPSNAFQLSAEMLSVPQNFDAEEGDAEEGDANEPPPASKASTFPKQNAKSHKDESQPMFNGSSSSNTELSRAASEEPKFSTWNEVPDEKVEGPQRDYRKNWKIPTAENKPTRKQDVGYYHFARKKEPSEGQSTVLQNGSNLHATSTVNNSADEKKVRNFRALDKERSTSVASAPSIKFVERSAKDVARGPSASSEFAARESTSVNISKGFAQDKKGDASKELSQPAKNETSTTTSKQGLSLKDIPLRFSLNGYQDVSRANVAASNEQAFNERKFRRQRVDPRELENDSSNAARPVQSNYLFGQGRNAHPPTRPENVNGKFSTQSEIVPRNNERTVDGKSSFVRTQKPLGANIKTSANGNTEGSASKSSLHGSKNVSIVRIGSNSSPPTDAGANDVSCEPKIVKSKPKIRPKSCPVEENPRDALFQAIRKFGKQNLRKVSDDDDDDSL